jgi:predicted Zn-dependent protease
MGLSGWNGVVLVAAAGLWLASGTQREKPVLADPPSDALRLLEADVAAHPLEAKPLQNLAQAYLDAASPGLAVSVIERAPSEVRQRATVDHTYARALLDQGRAVDALAAERRVLAVCNLSDGCDAWLVASATHRADILNQLVQLGIEDARAHPEASLVAYHNATREARLSVE